MAERNGADLLARYAASIAASFKAPAHMARIVDAEAVLQWRERRGAIPQDTGRTMRAMTELRSPDRETNARAGTVQIIVKTPGAYWQDYRLPRIDPAEMARAVGESTFEKAARSAGVKRR
jgi:hypothetical protein